jgi:hypothetical protein
MGSIGARAAVAVVLGAVAWLALWGGEDSRVRPEDDAGGAPDTTSRLETPGPFDVEDLGVPALVGSVEPLRTAAVDQQLVVHVIAWLERGALEPRPAPELELAFGFSKSRFKRGDPVATAVTDVGGRATVALPWSAAEAVLDAEKPVLWVRTSGEGYASDGTKVALPATPDEDLELTLDAYGLTEVSGLLVDGSGHPIRGTVESLVSTEHGWASRRAGRAGADGRFRAVFRQEGVHMLAAEGTTDATLDDGDSPSRVDFDLGTGESDPFDVRFRQPAPEVVIAVTGSGVLQGRLVDAEGRPAMAVELHALLVGPDGGEAPEPARRAGFTQKQQQTTADGAFQLRGLREGRYHLWARMGEWEDSNSTRLTAEPVPSDGAPLELLFDRPVLAIHVRHLDGSVPEQPITLIRRSPWADEDAWPHDPGLMVTRAGSDARTLWESQLHVDLVGPGEFSLELQEVRSVELGIVARDRPWQPVRVDAPAEGGRIDVELVMPPPVPPGTLVVDVVGRAGQALHQLVAILVLDVERGIVLLRREFEFGQDDAWPDRIAVPPGTYRLVVEGIAAHNRNHGYVSSRRRWGGWESVVTVGSGAEVPVTAVLGAGATLALRVLGEPDEADVEASRPWWKGARSRSEEELLDKARLVTLRLEQEGRWPVTVAFPREAWEGTTASGTHLFSSVPFGEDATSALLTPGEFTLVCRTQGGREIRRPVLLVAGQTTTLEVVFD